MTSCVPSYSWCLRFRGFRYAALRVLRPEVRETFLLRDELACFRPVEALFVREPPRADAERVELRPELSPARAVVLRPEERPSTRFRFRERVVLVGRDARADVARELLLPEARAVRR